MLEEGRGLIGRMCTDLSHKTTVMESSFTEQLWFKYYYTARCVYELIWGGHVFIRGFH